METITFILIISGLYFGALGLVYLFRLVFDLTENIIKFNKSRKIIKTRDFKMKYYEVAE